MTTKSEKRGQKHLLEAKNDEKRTFLPLFSLLVVIKNLYETYRYYNSITYSLINKLIFCENGVLKSRILLFK